MAKVMIPLIGGPFDAADDTDPRGTVDVELDANDKPVEEFYQLTVPGGIDLRTDPSSGDTMSYITHFYELEERGIVFDHELGRPRPRWVYVHKGQTTKPATARRWAA